MEENPLRVRTECCSSCYFYMAMTGKPSCGVQAFDSVRPFYLCIHYKGRRDTIARVYSDNVKDVSHGRKA